MKKINITDARRDISDIVAMAERGEEFVILLRGQPIAQITRYKQKSPAFPSMAKFRAEIGAPTDGEPLSETVIRARREAHY